MTRIETPLLAQLAADAATALDDAIPYGTKPADRAAFERLAAFTDTLTAKAPLRVTTRDAMAAHIARTYPEAPREIVEAIAGVCVRAMEMHEEEAMAQYAAEGRETAEAYMIQAEAEGHREALRLEAGAAFWEAAGIARAEAESMARRAGIAAPVPASAPAPQEEAPRAVDGAHAAPHRGTAPHRAEGPAQGQATPRD